MLVNKLLRDLKKNRRYLTEATIFNEEEDPMYNEYEDGGYDDYDSYGDEYDEDPREMQRPMRHSDSEGDSEEEKELEAQETIKHEPIIGKIREIAIEGLKKYANEPTSKIYEFFKKVFLESDKVLTDTSNK